MPPPMGRWAPAPCCMVRTAAASWSGRRGGFAPAMKPNMDRLCVRLRRTMSACCGGKHGAHRQWLPSLQLAPLERDERRLAAQDAGAAPGARQIHEVLAAALQSDEHQRLDRSPERRPKTNYN